MSTKSVNKPKTLEVIQGELYVFGNKLPRHPEFPWLFSATALHKFCEKAIRNDAKRNQVDDEKYYNAKRPAQWLRRNVFGENNTEQVAYWAKYTRRRVKKYGPNLGFAERLTRKSDATAVTVTPDTVRLGELSDLKTVCVTVNGGSGPSSLKGTYICQHVVVEYVGTFSPKFKAAVSDIFLSVLNGEVETVTEEAEENAKKARGTKVRQENKELFYDLVEACGRKKLIPLKAQQGINEGTLGMTGAKYKKLYGVPEPLNDNLTVAQVRVKNMSMIIATKDISDHADDKISPEEGVKIGRLAALQSRVVLSGRLNDRILKEVALLEKEDKANEKRLTREFKAGKRPALPE